MKTIFAVLALLVACSYAAPAPGNLIKGDAHMEEPMELTKGEQNTVETGEMWIPFWGYISSWFKSEPKPVEETNEIKPEPRQRPNREDFEDSGEFLEAENTFHFGESEEEQQLVHVDSEEVRRSPFKKPAHVKDALLYGKVLPKEEDFSDYGDFLEATNRHLMGPKVVKKAAPKVKSTWNTWFSKW